LVVDGAWIAPSVETIFPASIVRAFFLQGFLRQQINGDFLVISTAAQWRISGTSAW